MCIVLVKETLIYVTVPSNVEFALKCEKMSVIFVQPSVKVV